MNWYPRDQFYTLLEEAPPTEKPWQYVGFDIDRELLYAAIPLPYVDTPDDDSFPSGVHRWYGKIDDSFFVLDVFYEQSPNECTVIIPYSLRPGSDWQILLDLEALPASVARKRVVYISSRNSQPVRTVYRAHPYGYLFPVYDAGSDEEAHALIQFLTQGEATAAYSVSEPETNITWVAVRCVEKNVDANHSSPICRYNSRTATIHFACTRSLSSPDNYLVFSESPDLDGRRYLIHSGRVGARSG